MNLSPVQIPSDPQLPTTSSPKVEITFPLNERPLYGSGISQEIFTYMRVVAPQKSSLPLWFSIWISYPEQSHHLHPRLQRAFKYHVWLPPL